MESYSSNSKYVGRGLANSQLQVLKTTLYICNHIFVIPLYAVPKSDNHIRVNIHLLISKSLQPHTLQLFIYLISTCISQQYLWSILIHPSLVYGSLYLSTYPLIHPTPYSLCKLKSWDHLTCFHTCIRPICVNVCVWERQTEKKRGHVFRCICKH